MATPVNATRLALKYRRRINADTFSGGATYNEGNFDLESTGADYGHAAQTNQEILDLMENSVNMLLDQMAMLAVKNVLPPAGKFITYGVLESIVPEYVQRKIEIVAFEPEIIATFDLEDYGYPIALNLFIVGEDLPKTAEPTTSEMYQRVKSSNWYEYNTIPIYRVTPGALSGKVGVTVYYQGAEKIAVPGGAGLEFYYLSRQKKITQNDDLLLSPKYDEHVLNLMVQSYERYK
jgi:hypothetical protein